MEITQLRCGLVFEYDDELVRNSFFLLTEISIYLAMRVLSALFAAFACASAAPEKFAIKFTTDINASGNNVIMLNVTRSDAPIGADHLYELVQDGFYDQAAYFRVVPNFVLQFGIAGEPAENKKWNKPINDDPVVGSNLAGTVSYATAGPNTRTTQLFINYVDNKQLDTMGFAPVGIVTQGLDVAKAVFNPTPGNPNGVDQQQYTSKGNTWIKQEYPTINFITNATIVH